MKTIIIYRNKNNQVISVRFKPEKISYDELSKKIVEYNNSGENQACPEAIPDYLYDAILFLMKDRSIDLKMHLDSLQEIKDSISDMDDCLSSIVRDIKNKINSHA